MGQESWYHRHRAVVPSSNINASPGGCVFVSDEWWPIIVGLLENGIRDSFWDANTGAIAKGIDGILQLIGQENSCVGNSTAIFKEETPSGVHAGAAIAGWQDRPTLTEQTNNSDVVFANGVITPAFGTYIVEISAPAFMVGKHRVALCRADTNTVAIAGSSEYSYNASSYSRNQTRSVYIGGYAFNGQLSYKLRHYCQFAKTLNGLGVLVGDGEPERYGFIRFTRLENYP